MALFGFMVSQRLDQMALWCLGLQTSHLGEPVMCPPLPLSLISSSRALLLSGVKNADENELKAIASPPEETHVYNVADFSVMSDIVEGLTKGVCDRVDQLDKQIKGLF